MSERNSQNAESRKVRRFREGFEGAERARKLEAGKPENPEAGAIQKEIGKLFTKVAGTELAKAQAGYETRQDA